MKKNFTFFIEIKGEAIAYHSFASLGSLVLFQSSVARFAFLFFFSLCSFFAPSAAPFVHALPSLHVCLPCSGEAICPVLEAIGPCFAWEEKKVMLLLCFPFAQEVDGGNLRVAIDAYACSEAGSSRGAKEYCCIGFRAEFLFFSFCFFCFSFHGKNLVHGLANGATLLPIV